MNHVFERLSFKQKIIFGFSLLSAILIFGMGYMLFEFTNISQLSTNIIEKQRPIIRSSSHAREHAQSAANYLHEFLLNSEESSFENYSKTIEKLKENIKTLFEYSKNPGLNLSVKELDHANEIIEEINLHVIQIKKYKNNYEENHPVINIAASVLNPLALEYLGLINSIIYEGSNSGLPREILIGLSDMRHSWSQMLSSLRITLATKQAREFLNVKAFADLNKKQISKFEKLNFNPGFGEIAELERIRKEYRKHLDLIIDEFDSQVWRRDANLMKTKVMPLFDDLDMCLYRHSNIQLKEIEKADKLLSQHLNFAYYSYISLILVSLVAAFLISGFITNSVRKPLKKLVNASNEVAKGNFNTEIKITGNDEISYLARTFNDMVNKLQESQLALTTARDVAEHANHAKSEFLTRMSHELRTPLNAILGFAQMLNIDSPKKNDLNENEYVKNILKSGWHLLDLVDELLDFSRIETNRIIVKSEKNEILSLLHECVDIVRPLAEEKKILVLDNVNDDVGCYSNVDAVHFKQVVLNLLSNAIKYNSENGKATVQCDFIADQFIKILVCDEGIGLTKEQKTEVFDAFQRLDADEKAIGGIGLGLNIAKNLVELMNGKIGVESKKGKGSCFWIELPIIEIIEKTDGPAKILEDKDHARNKDAHKVLYIEDDPFNSELMREILTVLRPEIILFEAETAEAGLEIAKNEDIDLILMDLNLPGMSGQEALDELKKNTETENIPVVAVSADAVKESVDMCKKQGFKEYLTKPIDVDYFIDIVDTILVNRKTN